MFADEIGGSRKKAEDAKKKRLQLKQLQQKKAATSAKIAALSSTSVQHVQSPVVPVEVDNAVSATSSSTFSPMATSRHTGPNVISPSITTSKTNSLSAVEIAAEQRQIRAKLALQNRIVTKTQAIYRSYIVRKHQTELLTTELQKKLFDVETLHNMLLKKSSVYVLPTTMATTLVRQFMFVSSGNVRRNDFEAQLTPLLSKLLDFVVIPGVENSNNDKNPILPWIDSSVGIYRLHRFLQFLLHRYYSTLVVPCLESIIRCLRALLVGSSMLQLHCRSLLLPDNNTDVTSSQSTFDMIRIIRQQLLLMGDKPIPSGAESIREKCFAPPEKKRIGMMIQLLLDVIVDRPIAEVRYQQSRIIKEFFTIPLLGWRLSITAITSLTSSSSSSPLPSAPSLITLIEGFTTTYADQLNDCELEGLLNSPDLSMTICPATGSQRLLANLLHLSRFIPACNGEVVTRLDYTSTAKFFRFIAALVDDVPVGTFTSTRESTITWINIDGNQKPIVLSPIILEQCKSLLVESYVRRIFNASIDTQFLQTDHVLTSKNEQDLKHERDWNESSSSSAATLAAKEARIDRNKKFWNSSNWARKLSKGVSNLLSSSETNKNADINKNNRQTAQTDSDLVEAIAAGLLQDTSSLARQFAEGTQNDESKSAKSTEELRRNAYSTDLLFSLIQTYSILFARWGGGGNDDVVALASGEHRPSVKSKSEPKATPTPDAWVKSILNALCFSTPIVRITWGIIQSNGAIVQDMYNLIEANRTKTQIRSLSNRPYFASSTDNRSSRNREMHDHDGPSTFHFFLCTFSHILIITDDTEIHDMERPLPLHQIRRCIHVLKKFLYRVTCSDGNSSADVQSDQAKSQGSKEEATNYFGLALISSSARVMRDLYDRSSRRPFCLPSMWTISGLMEKEIGQCKTFADYQSLLSSSAVLKVCPFMVSFKRRLQLFERIINTNRVEMQGENSSNPFHNNPLKPGIPVRINRSRLLEDGIATMNNLGKNMRQRISVQYVNEAGVREIGIDAGGLFKEFWTDLCAIAFDPNYALFRVTDGGSDASVGNCLYPNPLSAAAHGMEHTTLFGFLGRILGKALYEGITIHPKFAHFFLSFLKGDYNFLHMLPDLSTVDSQLYNNLMFLKTYDGDASDLTLTFTVNVDEFGGTREIPLIPNGANVDVTNSNKHYYIGLVAKYYVYDRIREQSEAMTRGLFEVVDRSWLRLFNEPELQVLISGATEGKLDVEDMKAHCQYAGGYSSLDRTICKFWRVVATLDEKQQGALLRFVTSCERPPPLGFGSLIPPLTIQRVGILRDGDRLPTASTCFNILKLPTYSSEKILRQRLIYAIESGAGFELT